MAARIAVIGNINCDFVFRVPRLPRPGETLAGSAFFTAAGGKGANQAVAAARLGAQVSFVGCVGADTTGADMLSHLGADGVDISRVRTDPKEATGSALIMVQDSGENSIVVAARGEPRDRPEHLAEHRELLQNCDALMLQQEMRIETNQRGDSYRQGGRVSGDSGPRAGARGPASSMARGRCAESQRDGGRIDSEQPRARCAIGPGGGGSAPAATGTEAVALKAAARGSFVADGAGAVAVPSFPVEAVDSTAAGMPTRRGWPSRSAKGESGRGGTVRERLWRPGGHSHGRSALHAHSGRGGEAARLVRRMGHADQPATARAV